MPQSVFRILIIEHFLIFKIFAHHLIAYLKLYDRESKMKILFKRIEEWAIYAKDYNFTIAKFVFSIKV